MKGDLEPQNPGEVIADWLLQQGLQSVSQFELLEGYCQKLVECGIPLMRLHVAERAFHPYYGGVGFDWLRETGVSQELYEHTNSPLDRWTQSPLYHMLDTNTFEFRKKLTDLDESNPFPLLTELKETGGTDYFALAMLFEKWDLTKKLIPTQRLKAR